MPKETVAQLSAALRGQQPTPYQLSLPPCLTLPAPHCASQDHLVNEPFGNYISGSAFRETQ